MDERRRYTGRTRSPKRPTYQVAELAALLGGGDPRTTDDELRADMRRLSAIGLVTITAHAIEFATSMAQLRGADLAGFEAMIDRLPNNRRTVPVPRRTLRALAAGLSRAVTGVTLAMLIRSLFWHKEEGRYRVDGRTKGSWIAQVFGISRRAVTDARKTLIELGMIVPLESSQWALNRWGSHDQINPDWEGGAGAAAAAQPADRAAAAERPTCGGESASLRRETAGESARPYRDRSSFSLPGKDLDTRRLGGPAPAGALRKGKGRGHPPRERCPAPTIRDIRLTDLRCGESTETLYRQAVAAGLAGGSEAGKLEFFALAERAKAHGHSAGALLYWLLRERKSRFITQANEDAAARRLRELREGRRHRQRGGSHADQGAPEAGGLTPDEWFVQACLRIANQHRVSDPFKVASLRGWTREQWESTLQAYEEKQFDTWRAAVLPQEGAAQWGWIADSEAGGD